jgi:hypothetical protein
MPHSCQVVALSDHFVDSTLRPVFDAYLEAAERNGPVTVNSTKSRITFQVRMRFAGLDTPRRDHLRAYVVLRRRRESPRFAKVEFIPPSYYVHRFKLRTPADVDGEVREWLAEAYLLGAQRKEV